MRERAYEHHKVVELLLHLAILLFFFSAIHAFLVIYFILTYCLSGLAGIAKLASGKMHSEPVSTIET